MTSVSDPPTSNSTTSTPTINDTTEPTIILAAIAVGVFLVVFVVVLLIRKHMLDRAKEQSEAQCESEKARKKERRSKRKTKHKKSTSNLEAAGNSSDDPAAGDMSLPSPRFQPKKLTKTPNLSSLRELSNAQEKFRAEARSVGSSSAKSTASDLGYNPQNNSSRVALNGSLGSPRSTHSDAISLPPKKAGYNGPGSARSTASDMNLINHGQPSPYVSQIGGSAKSTQSDAHLIGRQKSLYSMPGSGKSTLTTDSNAASPLSTQMDAQMARQKSMQGGLAVERASANSNPSSVRSTNVESAAAHLARQKSMPGLNPAVSNRGMNGGYGSVPYQNNAMVNQQSYPYPTPYIPAQLYNAPQMNYSQDRSVNVNNPVYRPSFHPVDIGANNYQPRPPMSYNTDIGFAYNGAAMNNPPRPVIHQAIMRVNGYLVPNNVQHPPNFPRPSPLREVDRLSPVVSIRGPPAAPNSNPVSESPTTDSLSSGEKTLNATLFNAKGIFTTVNSSTMMSVRTIVGQKAMSLPAFVEMELGKDFELLTHLASGGLSKIFFCDITNPQFQKSGVSRCVAKQYNETDGNEDEEVVLAFQQEVAIMWYFKDHGNIAQMIGYDLNSLILVMPFYELGALANFLSQPEVYESHFSLTWSMDLMHQLALDISQGLLAMHKAGIVHNDMKVRCEFLSAF